MAVSARQKSQAQLDALNALDPATDRAAQNEIIGNALRDKSSRVVAKAATLAGERHLHEREKDLLAAYARFLVDPVKRDPNCFA